ncbi:MAG: hypothetical protein Satyrvirus5_28 [Satyrvirus sp.]|uniref:Uncharacterized protein n=1 Tax=Satyrvirus sp. TaxID=2487771 RepID=A0A3G5AH23_9VIRU|nr:MAG: hypothetical protein Satyrvirus5_28 [Satyrvirus sp.]
MSAERAERKLVAECWKIVKSLEDPSSAEEARILHERLLECVKKFEEYQRSYDNYLLPRESVEIYREIIAALKDLEKFVGGAVPNELTANRKRVCSTFKIKTRIEGTMNSIRSLLGKRTGAIGCDV